MKWTRLKSVAVVLLLLSTFLFFALPKIVDRFLNTVHLASTVPLKRKTDEVERKVFTADMHADTLLWNRELANSNKHGHIDLPRMLKANVGLQIFSAVTKTPRHLNFERNDAKTDNITLLAIMQRWPIRTWDSRIERALYQAERLHGVSQHSNGQLVVIRSGRDLSDYLMRRSNGAKITAAMLAIEGLHALDGDINNLDRLHAAGYRMMGLTHFFDNEIGGSAHGVNKTGLTELGYQVVEKMERLGIIIDLAHGSEALISDVAAVAKRPLVISHTGVKGTCDRTRNLSDEQLKMIADTGGLVGIAYFPEAICSTKINGIAAAIRYTANVIGVRYTALGSDFDGAVSTPIDITGLPLLVEALEQEGFSREEIAAIMGGNIVRLLKQNLHLD
ncbi:MAG: membrane dipeptidase [Gammaproteobacteria bacterium]|jgi:membrane dipeptidase